MSSRAAWLHLAGKALFQALTAHSDASAASAKGKLRKRMNTTATQSLPFFLSKSLTSRARGLCDIVLGGVE